MEILTFFSLKPLDDLHNGKYVDIWKCEAPNKLDGVNCRKTGLEKKWVDQNYADFFLESSENEKLVSLRTALQNRAGAFSLELVYR